MKGTMQISKLKKKAAYYYVKDYDEKCGGDFVFFIEPFPGTEDDCFYYVRRLDNGKIEIEGEGYITTEEHLASHIQSAKKTLDGCIPAYYWRNDKNEVIEKTYY